MKWRTAAVIIGTLGLACLFLVVAAVYPTSTSESSLEKSADERFVVEEADEYSVVAALTVDDQLVLSLDGVVTETGERYWIEEQEGYRIERYQPSPDGDVYTRMEFATEARAEPELELLENDDDRNATPVEHDDGSVTIFELRADRGDISSDIAGTASLLSRSLFNTEYDRVSEGNERYVYEPQNGWFDPSQMYRISDSSGTVVVDSETYELESAEVSWDQTELYELSYLHYLHTRATSDSTETHEVTYELEREDAEIAVPEWVAKLS